MSEELEPIDLESVANLLMRARTEAELELFLGKVLTPSQAQSIARRVAIARMVRDGTTQHAIGVELRTGMATVSRAARLAWDPDVERLLQREHERTAVKHVVIADSPAASAKFREAEIALGQLLAYAKGVNDPERLAETEAELRLIVAHLQACIAMLEQGVIHLGLAAETRGMLAKLKESLPYLGAALSALGVVLAL